MPTSSSVQRGANKSRTGYRRPSKPGNPYPMQQSNTSLFSSCAQARLREKVSKAKQAFLMHRTGTIASFGGSVVARCAYGLDKPGLVQRLGLRPIEDATDSIAARLCCLSLRRLCMALLRRQGLVAKQLANDTVGIPALIDLGAIDVEAGLQILVDGVLCALEDARVCFLVAGLI